MSGRDQGQARQAGHRPLLLIRKERIFAPVVFIKRAKERAMIRKLQSGQYRLYSRKVNPKTGRRSNLGTFKSRAAAEKHERDVQYFKRQ
jgi:hypothetical protein